MSKRWLVAFGIVLWPLLMATPAAAANMTITPSSVAPGGSVTVAGTVPIPGCPVPGTAIVDSPFNATDFVPVPYDATGHFTVHINVSSSIAPGTYTVVARCAGRNEPLGEAAGAEIGGPFPTFTVVASLARTGGSIGPLSDAAATAIASALVAIGCAAALAGRRRNMTGL